VARSLLKKKAGLIAGSVDLSVLTARIAALRRINTVPRLCRDYINPYIYVDEETGELIYDAEKASEAMREKYPCYQAVELKRGACPVCGWKPYYTSDGSELIPKYQRLYYPDPNTVAERELDRLHKQSGDKVKKRMLIEKAMSSGDPVPFIPVGVPRYKPEDKKLVSNGFLPDAKTPIDPSCTLPKATGRKCNKCPLAKGCEEDIKFLGRKTAWTVKNRVGKNWGWRKT